MATNVSKYMKFYCISNTDHGYKFAKGNLIEVNHSKRNMKLEGVTNGNQHNTRSSNALTVNKIMTISSITKHLSLSEPGKFFQIHF